MSYKSRSYRYNSEIIVHEKPVILSVHAIKNARLRNIAFPDQVYNVLLTGKVERFAKHGIRIIGRSKHGRILCVGEDVGYAIIIKTIERGN